MKSASFTCMLGIQYVDFSEEQLKVNQFIHELVTFNCIKIKPVQSRHCFTMQCDN